MRKELINRLASEMGVSKTMSGQCLDIVEAFLADELKTKGEVALFGLGKLAVKKRASRAVVSLSGEKMIIPERKAVVFSAFKSLKEMVNEQ